MCREDPLPTSIYKKPAGKFEESLATQTKPKPGEIKASRLSRVI
jgi:hypothetical protein